MPSSTYKLNEMFADSVIDGLMDKNNYCINNTSKLVFIFEETKTAINKEGCPFTIDHIKEILDMYHALNVRLNEIRREVKTVNKKKNKKESLS